MNTPAFHPDPETIARPSNIESEFGGEVGGSMSAELAPESGTRTEDTPEGLANISISNLTSPSLASIGFLPASVEPDSFDKFLSELDAVSELSLEPNDASPTATASPRSRVISELTRTKTASSYAPSVSARSTSSIRTSFRYKLANVASLVSASAFCSEYLESRPYRTYTVRTFCESLFNSRRAANTKITSVKRYGDRYGVPHRFLIFHIVRGDGRDFYLRVDRRRDRNVPLLAFGPSNPAGSPAMDTVAISGQLEKLHDHTKAGEEAIMSFTNPPPLIAAAQVLYAVAAESQGYSLTKENCWFFASIIQEVLIRNFGGRYDTGSLHRPNLAKERRVMILGHTYRETSREFERGSAVLTKITTLIGDSTLAEAVRTCINTLREQHESIYRSASPDNAHRFGRSVQDLFSVLYRKLHEHLHACCGVQGARLLSDTRQLLDALRGLERIAPTAVPNESVLRNIIRVIADSQMSLAQTTESRYSSLAYTSVQHELDWPSAFPLHARRLALSVLELLPDCQALDGMPETWRYQLNRDIPDLEAELAKWMSKQLAFVCRHWIHVLCEVESPDDEIVSALYRCIPALRHWIAAMGIVGEISQACRALHGLYQWLGTKSMAGDIRWMVYGLHRCAGGSRKALAISSLSILGTAHPFVPLKNPLHQAFATYMASRSRIVAEHTDTSQAWPSQESLRIHNRAAVHHVEFSPDGYSLASAGRDNVVRLWDPTTGAHVRELKGHTGATNCVTFSPDGTCLASAANDHTVRLWDLTAERPSKELRGHTGDVWGVAISSDGRYVASASTDHTVRLWDAATGAPLREFTGHTAQVPTAAFSPDGRHIASGSWDHSIRIWDVATGASVRKIDHVDQVVFLTYSPDGRRIASTAYKIPVRLWDALTGALVHTFSRIVWNVAFSPDGRHLASAGHDRTVQLWDATTGAHLREFKGHTDGVWSVAFSPDGHHLASGSHDQVVQVWNLDSDPDAPLRALKGHTGWVTSVAFSLDGGHLVSTSRDHSVCVWEVASGNCLVHKIPNRSMLPQDTSFTTDGSILAIHYTAEYVIYLHFPSLDDVTGSLSTSFRSTPLSSRVYLDGNSLCVKAGDIVLHACWLPDYFEPTTSVVQHGENVCVGGKEGMIAFVDLDGLGSPDL